MSYPQTNREKGFAGEEEASQFLKNLKFKIIERNFQARCGEIDIIAVNKKALHFIEVKARANLNYGHPIEAVTTHKRRHLAKAAWYYLLSHPEYLEYEKRMSVLGLHHEGGICHIDFYENAFGVYF